MSGRFSDEELFRLRNFIPINTLIQELGIPYKTDDDGIFRFTCPFCYERQTATKQKTNLARCFLCEKNFNTIDLVMICKRQSFIKSVLFLQSKYKKAIEKV